MKQITCPHCGDNYPDVDVAHVCSKGPYAPKLKPKMNERIRLLAEQAKKYALDAMIKITDKEQALKVYSESYDTKLAELIVQECIEQASIGNGHGNNQWDRALTFSAKNIKEHFGVE